MKFFVAIYILLELVSAAEAARWTMHRSCYENAEYRDGLIKAVETAKERSALCASKLGSKNPLDSFKRLARLFIKESDMREMKGRYELFAGLEGPIGKDSGFADSNDWTGRSNPYRTDFIFYCAPDVIQKDTGYGSTVPFDDARSRSLGPESPLILFQKEMEKGTWLDDKVRIAASTSRDTVSIVTEGDVSRIPNTITINPIWLQDKIKNGELFVSDETLKKMTDKNALSELKKSWTAGSRSTPVDTIIEDLSGLVHHEMFHLDAFGGYNDTPDDGGAYNWMNNIENKVRDNPELMAIIAIIFDLKENKKLTVNKDGELKK